MTYDEIMALSVPDLDLAVARIMGDTVNEFSTELPYGSDMRSAWRVAERFKLTVTPKKDATEKSRWLADPELKDKGHLWLGHGPTAAVAICRAALLMHATL